MNGKVFLVNSDGKKMSEGIPVDMDIDWSSTRISLINNTRGEFAPLNSSVERVMFVDEQGEEICWIQVPAPTTKGDIVRLNPGPVITLDPF